MDKRKLHNWQIVLETNGKLDYMDINSENDELTEELFNTILKLADFNSKILSITRIN